jgi:phage tail sheath protein FI
VEEIPSGVHTIVGVATSIAAFIDTFQRGPTDYAVHLFSLADFERILGGLEATSEASYGIQQFFLNGGTECYAVRVVDPGAKAAAIDILDAPGAGALSFTPTAGQKIGTTFFPNPGAWGNDIRLEVDYDTSDPTTLFNLTVSEVDDTGKVVQSEVFRNLNMIVGDPAYALEVVNDGSRIVGLSTTAGLHKRPSATGTLSGTLPATAPASLMAGAKFNITVDVDGTLNHYVATLPAVPATPPKDYPSLRPYLEAVIRGAAPSSAADLANNPMLTGATVQLTGNQFRIITGRGGNAFNPDALLETAVNGVDTLAHDLMLDPGSTSKPVFNIQQYSLGGTAVGAQKNPVVGIVDVTLVDDKAIRGLEASKTGMYALEDVDIFNILCIPAAARGGSLAKIDDNAADLIVTEATAFCESHYAMFIVDIPKGVNDVVGMQIWMTAKDTYRDPNLATYFPRVRIPDPLNSNRLRDVGPSGTLAGLWAATDVGRGVWKAPAGVDTQLRGVSQLVYNLVDRENGVLNPIGINSLRNFPIYGNVSWGARTLYGADVQASEWKYIPVRRLAKFLEVSLLRGTKWAIYEPNDEPLWAQLRMNVTSFMHDLFRQGAFQGASPDQAYLVKCDSEINTQYEIDRGIVNVLVGFAPLKPTEFLILQIQQRAAQSTA